MSPETTGPGMTDLAFEAAMALPGPWTVDQRWILAGWLFDAFARQPGWVPFALAEA